MNLLNRLSLVVLSFVVATNVLTAETAPKAEATAVKVGLVDVQKVILNVAEGKSERTKLENQFNSRDKELSKLREEVKKLGEELQSPDKVALMSEENLRKKQETFQQKFMQAQQDEMKLRQDIKTQEQDATNKIAGKVALIVEDMAKKQNIDVVFESNSSGLMFVKNPSDLTDEVIKVYDKTPGNVAKKK